MGESDRVTRQARILPCVLKGDISQVKHLHLFVGGVNSGSLEETTEAIWTSTGHETLERHREMEGERKGHKTRGRNVPQHLLCDKEQTKTTRQRDLLEEKRETLREVLWQT
jgi:hypothetical protein